MANVMFKRGTQAALNTLINGSGERFADGCFYLTTDTDRLYVAQSKSELVELNKSITIINTLAELNTLTEANTDIGQFYYIKGKEAGALVGDKSNPNVYHNVDGGNILAVCVGFKNTTDANGKRYADFWQVNPDTNTDTNDDTRVLGLEAEKNTKQSSNTQLVYDITLTQEKLHNGGTWTKDDSIERKAQLTISANDITNLVTDTAVDVDSSSVTNNKTTISTTGAGASGNGFTIAGTNGRVTLSDDTDGIIIDTPDYYINSPAVSGATNATSAEINLGDENGSATNSEKRFGTVAIKAGEDLAINNTVANEITIYHKNSGVTTGEYGKSASTTPAAGTGKIKVPNVTVDAQGHVTAISNQEITLPADNNDYITKIEAAATGNVKVTRTNGNFTTNTNWLYHTIDIYDANGTKTTPTKYNQSNLGAFYDKTAIDTKLRGLNAMTYRGTVFGTGATKSTLPTSDVQNGDAYLANLDSGSYKKGDLIIATGTENNSGVIPSDDILWTVVSSGTDTDTTYTFGTNGTTIQATPQPSGTAVTIATFENGNELTAAAGASANSIKYNHNVSGVTAGSKGLASDTGNLAHGGTFKVPYITVNTYGHVTGLEEHTVTLPAADLYSWTQDSTTPTKIILKHNSTNQNDVTWEGSGVISVAGNASTKKITVSHNNVSRSDNGAKDNTPTTSLAHSGKFKAITDVTSNAQGHITGVRFTEFTLPSDNNTTYTLKSATLSGLASGTTGAQLLLDSTGTDSYVNITSQSLSVVATPTLAISVDLVWGSF